MACGGGNDAWHTLLPHCCIISPRVDWQWKRDCVECCSFLFLPISCLLMPYPLLLSSDILGASIDVLRNFLVLHEDFVCFLGISITNWDHWSSKLPTKMQKCFQTSIGLVAGMHFASVCALAWIFFTRSIAKVACSSDCCCIFCCVHVAG